LKQLIATMVFSTVLLVVAVVGNAAMRLTGDWMAFDLVILSAIVLGTGLVAYSDRRARLRRRIPGEQEHDRCAA
jgi:hypothetical protein